MQHAQNMDLNKLQQTGMLKVIYVTSDTQPSSLSHTAYIFA